MYIKSKLFSFFIITVTTLFLLMGCAQQSQERKINMDEIGDKSYIFDIGDQEEMYFLLGKKLSKLSEIPDINNPAIIVNGYVITNKDVESEKVREEFSDSYTLKERINKLIRKKVEIAAATQLGIKPSNDEINDYLEQTKKIMKEDFNAYSIIQSYIEGRGITQDEYFDELEEEAYHDYQRMAWWEKVKPDEVIRSEANKRNENSSDLNYSDIFRAIDNEYHEKYVDELIDNAEIRFLNPEIEKFLYN